MSKSKKLRTLIKQAKMGKPYAMYQLGICYQLGRGRTQDLNEAANLISCAAESGYAPAIEWMKDYYFDDDACVQAEI
jgi:TPR repeat protein